MESRYAPTSPRKQHPTLDSLPTRRHSTSFSPLPSPIRTRSDRPPLRDSGQGSTSSAFSDHHAPPDQTQRRTRELSVTADTLRSFVTVNRSEPSLYHHVSASQSGAAEGSTADGDYDHGEGHDDGPSTAGTGSSASVRPIKSRYMGTGAPEDPFVVCFDVNDPGDPRRWSKAYRWWIMTCACFEMTCGTLAISLFTPGTAQIVNEFHTKREIVVLGTTLYLFGLAISSLLTAPLGEMFGRRPVMIISFFLFTFFNLGISLCHNVPSLLILRFISGFFGSASMSHCPAMANDLFAEHEIGLPLILAGVGRFGGPVLGPLIGGWINQRVGWRWLGYTQTIVSGASTLVATFLVPETYAPAILQRRAKALAAEIGAHHITSYEAGRVIGGWADEAKKYLVRPFLLLVMEPIVFLLSLHVSFLYGILNLYFSAYPFIFTSERHWSQGMAGLPFIACIIGFIISTPIAHYCSVPYLRAAARSPTGKAQPEERLWFGILGAGLLPVALFWLAWTAQPSVHWLAPVASGVIFAIGQLGLTLSCFSYFSDTYTYQMGSVLAGSNFMRFSFGGIFPLFSNQMFVKLGAGWSLSILGFLCVLFFPVPILFYVYGAKIREWSKYVPAPPVDSEKALVAAAVVPPAARAPFPTSEVAGDQQQSGKTDVSAEASEGEKSSTTR